MTAYALRLTFMLAAYAVLAVALLTVALGAS